MDRNVEVTVNDQVSAPEYIFDFYAPEIHRISGCTDVDNHTMDCPSGGGITMTIWGKNFGLNLTYDDSFDASIYIGPKEDNRTCVGSSQVWNGTYIECTLPAGASI